MPANRAWMTCRVMGSTDDVKTKPLLHAGTNGTSGTIGTNSYPGSSGSKRSIRSKKRLRLISQPACLCLVEREITVNGIDGYVIDFPRALQSNVAVPYVIEYPCRVAFQRVA